VLGAEVWVKLVDADQPADSPIIASLGTLAALVFLTMTTKPTFHAKFKPGEGGKTAIYTAGLTHAARRAVVGDRDGDRRSMRDDDRGARECRDSRW